MGDRRVVDETEIKRINRFFRDSPRVADSLPRRLNNGSTLDEIECYCSSCSRLIKPKHFRGALRPSTRGYRLTAFGYCEACKLLTPYMYEITPHANSYDMESQKWRGWREGEVVSFSKK